METDPKDKLIEALRGFDTLMVSTKAANGATHGRPMAVAEVDDYGAIWFVTAKESAKVDEVKVDNTALVTGQEGMKFTSVTGRLDVVNDRERFKAMWKPAWKVWFPEGKEDPNAVLLRFTPEVGEYWLENGVAGVKYLFEAAKALATGTTPKDVSNGHAKVVMT